MARSNYIYLIYHKSTTAVLSAFTVKYEANQWAEKSQWCLDQLQLYRTRDGQISPNPRANPIVPIDWE